MARVITVTNQKGGVGKTTTAHLLACGLHIKGFKTLLIDLDPQSNLTFTMGAEDNSPTMYDLFKGNADIKHSIVETKQGDIIPGSLMLSGADMEYTQTGREYILRELLEPIKTNYDYIVIDTPPALGILTVNALTASNSVLIPMGADIYSIQGLSQLYDLIRNVKRYTNKSLTVDGLLLTRYNSRSKVNKEIREELYRISESLSTKLYDTTVRECAAIRKSQVDQSNIFFDEPKATAAQDYNSFINEYTKEREQK